ncbi:uncharacterized protein BX663DRAFT_553878 [Cokeromyces recurvatus]|uniref:uncharacterized protein n=1 Tax=Cokeromyces recurvatus TaxID=90255 RepID=UPI002220B9C8|nr:uncharacterized protein BX663DRAFT_553878 [Cokeromyces recurvatus]KAI7900571.1 hypothetical protein BX663DRAFT_553878 [Cokeromyces recurvatus]
MKLQVVCNICSKAIAYPILLKCGHVYDKECAQFYSKISSSCPQCQQMCLDEPFDDFDMKICSNSEQLIDLIDDLDLKDNDNSSSSDNENDVLLLEKENELLQQRLKTSSTLLGSSNQEIEVLQQSNKHKDQVIKDLNYDVKIVRKEYLRLKRSYDRLNVSYECLMKETSTIEPVEKILDKLIKIIVKERNVVQTDYQTILSRFKNENSKKPKQKQNMYEFQLVPSTKPNPKLKLAEDFKQAFKELLDHYDHQKTKLYAIKSLRERVYKKVLRFNHLAEQL